MAAKSNAIILGFFTALLMISCKPKVDDSNASVSIDSLISLLKNDLNALHVEIRSDTLNIYLKLDSALLCSERYNIKGWQKVNFIARDRIRITEINKLTNTLTLHWVPNYPDDDYSFVQNYNFTLVHRLHQMKIEQKPVDNVLSYVGQKFACTDYTILNDMIAVYNYDGTLLSSDTLFSNKLMSCMHGDSTACIDIRKLYSICLEIQSDTSIVELDSLIQNFKGLNAELH